MQPQKHGEGGGMRAALVGLHGFMATAATWDSMAAHLPGWHCAFPTCAPMAPAEATFDALAKVVDAAVRAAPEPPILLGYSMGGRIALEYLQRYPNAPIRALVLESAGLGPADEREREEYAERARAWAQRFRTQSPEEYVRWWESLPVMKASAEANAALRAMRLSCPSESLALLTEAAGPHAMHTAAENRALLASLTVPAIYVAGQDDAKYVAVARSLEAEGVQLHIFPGGHNAHAAHPQAFAQLIAAAANAGASTSGRQKGASL